MIVELNNTQVSFIKELITDKMNDVNTNDSRDLIDLINQFNQAEIKQKTIFPLKLIMEVVSKEFLLYPEVILSNNRKKEIMTARHWFNYLSRKLNPEITITASYIGSYLSTKTKVKRDHSTILNSFRVIDDLVSIYPKEKEREQRLIKIIIDKHNINTSK